MILHIPHASDVIPEDLRDQFVLTDKDLHRELILMTDAFTDELFFVPDLTVVRFPHSRLLVDVERFPDDAMESMSEVGMGVIYTLTAEGKHLKRTLQSYEIKKLFANFYETHHQTLLDSVNKELEQHGVALIVDCHSFPSQPLSFEKDQITPRPDFCIGTDAYHTPRGLFELLRCFIRQMGFSVENNRPYSGSIVPLAHHNLDSRVMSIMIEVNRSLYMDEANGMKISNFNTTKTTIQDILKIIGGFGEQLQLEAGR